MIKTPLIDDPHTDISAVDQVFVQRLEAEAD